MISACTKQRARFAAAISFAAALSATPQVFGEDAPNKLYVHIETPGRFSYAGDATQVSILIKNEGKTTWTNPGIDIDAGFEAVDSNGAKLEKTKPGPLSRDTQPKALEPNAYFGKIVNLDSIFPRINTLGSYRITWSAAGLPEQTLVTRIIKKYDPARDYQAVIETDFGKVVLEFYKDLAPFHVKNFIDLANQDFYNGLLFHRIIKGEAIFGGSPTGDENGSPGYTVFPELSGLKVLPGMLAQVRNARTGSDESGSIFMLAATAQPDMDGRVTVFARVVEGLETVKAITNLPTVGGPPRAASRPIKDVVIKKIEIREKKSAKSS